ncbi:hypothetical protein FQN60_000859 [Etheostoma spectabile]|uniref:Uncharacterized protein n=1 Tax=Etheostoma spectabile TaxID=54343 RepID=A0A5J5D1H4_9PERO|nr:hypothetical protein FQN60_000859 [Etheostoma spectabile]
MIQKCSTGHVGIEDSADGSAMLRSTSLVTTVALEDTGWPAWIITVLCCAILASACTSTRADISSSGVILVYRWHYSGLTILTFFSINPSWTSNTLWDLTMSF